MTKRRRNGSRSKYGEQVTVTTLLRPRYLDHRCTSRHPVCAPSRMDTIHPDARTVPVTIPIPTLEPAVARLSQTLSNLTTSHSTNVSAMTSAADELAQIEEKEKELREAIERTEAQRSWFAAFREFVEGVAHFLDEKVKSFVLFPERNAHTIRSIPLWRSSRRNTFLCSEKNST